MTSHPQPGVRRTAPPLVVVAGGVPLLSVAFHGAVTGTISGTVGPPDPDTQVAGSRETVGGRDAGHV
jgi:hypothetical protein